MPRHPPFHSCLARSLHARCLRVGLRLALPARDGADRLRATPAVDQNTRFPRNRREDTLGHTSKFVWLQELIASAGLPPSHKDGTHGGPLARPPDSQGAVIRYIRAAGPL